MSDAVLTELKPKLEKCIKAFQTDLQKMRTGRASLAILEDIRVDYYGVLTPINQVATLNVPEPRLITISPWDSKVIPDIEKAILKADLGVSPVNDGKLVRLPIPPLTEERRKDLVKMVKKMGEESKVALRHGRREAMDQIKKLEKDSHLPQDEAKHLSEEVEKVIHQFVEQIDKMVEHKEKELLAV